MQQQLRGAVIVIAGEAKTPFRRVQSFEGVQQTVVLHCPPSVCLYCPPSVCRYCTALGCHQLVCWCTVLHSPSDCAAKISACAGLLSAGASSGEDGSRGTTDEVVAASLFRQGMCCTGVHTLHITAHRAAHAAHRTTHRTAHTAHRAAHRTTHRTAHRAAHAAHRTTHRTTHRAAHRAAHTTHTAHNCTQDYTYCTQGFHLHTG